MLTWKIVGISKASVLYRYIDYKFDLKRYYFYFYMCTNKYYFFLKKTIKKKTQSTVTMGPFGTCV